MMVVAPAFRAGATLLSDDERADTQAQQKQSGQHPCYPLVAWWSRFPVQIAHVTSAGLPHGTQVPTARCMSSCRNSMNPPHVRHGPVRARTACRSATGKANFSIPRVGNNKRVTTFLYAGSMHSMTASRTVAGCRLSWRMMLRSRLPLRMTFISHFRTCPHGYPWRQRTPFSSSCP